MWRNLPGAYHHLLLEPCKGLRSNCLEIFIDSGYACVKFSTTLGPAGGAIKHSRTSLSSWKLECRFDSSTVDTSIGTRVQKVGWSSPLEKASSSFVSSFKASRRLRSVRFRADASRLFVVWRGVVVLDPTRGECEHMRWYLRPLPTHVGSGGGGDLR